MGIENQNFSPAEDTPEEAARRERIMQQAEEASRKAKQAYGDEPPPWLRD